jgi:hypothetical protein
MQALRNAAFLARLVLAWFALAIGVAVASPVVKPQAIELICSGGVIKLLASSDDGGESAAGHTLDCPLCASLAAPPMARRDFTQALPQGDVLRANPETRITTFTAAPPPARGPPASLPL